MSQNKVGLEITEDADPTQLFEILAKLGEGSYGAVYKALDKRDGEIVAIKVVEVENEDTESLRKEIAILKDCHSDYIVRYKGSFRCGTGIWIVMEYCGAGSVCDLMAICDRQLNEEQIASIMKMALQGLDYLHVERKKIHRDIKSGNLLLTHNGDCKLADFGVSAELVNTLSKRKTVIGTPYWMAPEVLQSMEYNGKADIWSLAITAIELAVGEPPHSNIHPMRAIFMIPNSDPPTLPDPSLWSTDFNDFLRVCLIKNPDKRPTARYLLQNHPFILKAKGKAVIARVVEECMAEIDEYREQEAREAQAGNNANHEQEDHGTMVNHGTGTMINSSGTINSNNTGTMIQTGSFSAIGDSGNSTPGNGGTMVFTSATLANNDQGQSNNNNRENNEFSTGTMVFGGSSGNSTGTIKGKATAEPQYMKHLRETKKGQGVTGASSTMIGANPNSFGTMISNNQNSNVANSTLSKIKVGAKGTVSEFSDFYKTSKELDLSSLNENSSLMELRTSLISLNKAYTEEREQLEKFYEDARKQIRYLITKKEEQAK